MPDPELHFTSRDLERWVTQGILSPTQLEQIHLDLQTVTPSTPIPAEPRKGLNLLTIAYYFGGFMILAAYAVFTFTMWNDLQKLGQVLITAVTITGLWILGAILRLVAKLDLPGNILIFAGVGIFPGLIYLLQFLSFGRYSIHTYISNDIYSLFVEFSGLAIAALFLLIVRFPLLTLLTAGWTWALSLDIINRFQGPYDNYINLRTEICTALFGLTMLIFGVLLQRRTRQDYSFWFYLFGHLQILFAFTAITLEKGELWGIAYILLYLTFIIASALLQRRIFLVFGALGAYFYAGYLTFSVFNGALGFIFAMGLMGLLIIFTAIGYQKFFRPWLETQIKRYRLVNR